MSTITLEVADDVSDALQEISRELNQLPPAERQIIADEVRQLVHARLLRASRPMAKSRWANLADNMPELLSEETARYLEGLLDSDLPAFRASISLDEKNAGL